MVACLRTHIQIRVVGLVVDEATPKDLLKQTRGASQKLVVSPAGDYLRQLIQATYHPSAYRVLFGSTERNKSKEEKEAEFHQVRAQLRARAAYVSLPLRAETSLTHMACMP